ncbi:MAG: XdhC family protein [Pseudomonadota bacterium]
MTFQFPEVHARLGQLIEAETPFVLATVVRTKNATSAKAGGKAIVEQDGTIVGWLGGGCVQSSVRDAARAVRQTGKPRLIKIVPKVEAADGETEGAMPLYRSSCPSGGTVEIFLEPVLPRAQLVICGGSPIARALADLGHWLGFAVVVAALADDLASFEAADQRIEGFDLSELPAASERYLVVATQGKRDKEALRAVLAVEAPYRAFVGSREKGKALKATLLGEGVDGERLRALKTPAGLDIGGIGPQEVALSVLTEIVAQRRCAQTSATEPSTIGLAANERT